MIKKETRRMILWDIAFVLFSLLCICQLCESTNPGVKLRLTKTGLDYANKIAHDQIVQQLKTLVIPDQSGQDGHISYSLTKIRVTGVTPPSTAVHLTPTKHGLLWSMSGLGISIHADWQVKYRRHVIHISDSGSVDVSLSGVNLAETAVFGVDKTGRPSIASSGCTDSIGSVGVDFHGGAAFILNLFRHTVENKIKEILQPKICEEVRQEVNGDAEKSLASMDVTVELAKLFLLDYRLAAAPAITADFIEIWSKGEIYWEADVKESPFVPTVIPAWNDNSRMVYIWVTAYSPNTFLYQAHTHGFLKYNLTKADLPPEDASYLDTSCVIKCIGTIIPQIGHSYPNSTVELRIRTSAVPKATITSKSVETNVSGIVEFWAHTPDKKVVYLLTLEVNTTFTLNASIVNEKLAGKITGHSLNVAVIKSAVGYISGSLLGFVIDTVLEFSVIPQLNKIAAKGIVLPMVQGVEFMNTQLILQEGAILIGTDVQYKGIKDETLHFHPELRRY